MSSRRSGTIEISLMEARQAFFRIYGLSEEYNGITSGKTSRASGSLQRLPQKVNARLTIYLYN